MRHLGERLTVDAGNGGRFSDLMHCFSPQRRKGAKEAQGIPLSNF
jgi:hypothetical protein